MHKEGVMVPSTLIHIHTPVTHTHTHTQTNPTITVKMLKQGKELI